MQVDSFRDAYISLKSFAGGKLTIDSIRGALGETGLSLERDPRLHDLDGQLDRSLGDTPVTLERFTDIMSGDGGLLALRAIQGGLAIADFPAFRDRVTRIFNEVATKDPVGEPVGPPQHSPRLAVLDAEYPAARNADYIPALSTAPDAWGVSICTVDGQCIELGDVERRFSIQSCCKAINYCQALESFNARGELQTNPGGNESAADKFDRLDRRAESRKVNDFGSLEFEERALGVHDFVDCEPSGEAFNAFSFNRLRMPYNPMINAGAIMAAALASRAGPTDIELEHVQRAWQALAGASEMPMPDTKTAKGEGRTGSNNRSIAYKMLANEAFPAFVQSTEHVENVLDFYFNCCALMLNTQELATASATLANRGVCPTTGERVYSAATVRDCLAAMLHCGMYDSSGRFGRLVGLPAKSGVGGGIMIVVPGVMGIATFSPRLDKIGNSLRGLAFIAKLLDVYKLHMLDAPDEVMSDRLLPDAPSVRAQSLPAQQVISAAELGDIGALQRFERRSRDATAFQMLLNSSDYDGRTPIHLAACGGHTELVQYLVDRGADPSASDRWHATPLDDARRLNQQPVVDVLERACGQDSKESSSIPKGVAEAWTDESVADMRNHFEPVECPHRSTILEDLELIWAAAKGDVGHIQRAACQGARLLVADYDDRTPLHLACAEGQPHVVSFIIDYYMSIVELQRDQPSPARLPYLLSWPDRWGRTAMDEAILAVERSRRGDEDCPHAACLATMQRADALTGKTLTA